jgi:threonine synthase
VTTEIGKVYRTHRYLLDPHSAIAWLALQESLDRNPGAHGVFLSTAHPGKFREVVEPAIGEHIALPQVLADAIARPRRAVSMAADYAALDAFLRS